MKTFEIWTGLDCIWCTRAKELITENGDEYEERLVTMAVMNEFSKRTNGAKKVPQIFLDDTQIGGYAELVEYYKDNH